MKKHLEHYGYFTGRNMAIARYGFEPKHGYRNEDSDESDTESDDSDNFDNMVNYNKFKGKHFAKI